MSFDVRNLCFVRRDWEIYSAIEDGVIVIRGRPYGALDVNREPIVGAEITRLHWKSHLYRPAEPLHDDILKIIGHRMADLVRDALQQGYAQAQLDFRKALGL
ncbi:hypothetical protein [Methylobacterium symbioticum]|uniref:Uncharacterized protein n=1 Tax=Methylobacterium symbioticum TaxID=2584084 RepID=A0A509ECC7_9HYPH|nr:hypothetical protein [Methylobacterium symbioticum]VUD71810.1 hypothetical protein MET9862_02398 [Methylobacterium symbioticum]